MKEPTKQDVVDALAHGKWLDELNERLSSESRMVVDLSKEVERLREWIRDVGSMTNTCTFDILRREVCEDCKCHRRPQPKVIEEAVA